MFSVLKKGTRNAHLTVHSSACGILSCLWSWLCLHWFVFLEKETLDCTVRHWQNYYLTSLPAMKSITRAGLQSISEPRGTFEVHKTERKFSGLPIDHGHEQNNAVIKGDGGAIGLTEDESALRRCPKMVAGSEVNRLSSNYETGQCKTKTADCGLRTADCGPGIKCRLSVKCRLQTESKKQAGVKCRPSINCSRGRV